MRSNGEFRGFLKGVRDSVEKLGSMGIFCGWMLVGNLEDGSVESADLLGSLEGRGELLKNYQCSERVKK